MVPEEVLVTDTCMGQGQTAGEAAWGRGRCPQGSFSESWDGEACAEV